MHENHFVVSAARDRTLTSLHLLARLLQIPYLAPHIELFKYAADDVLHITATAIVVRLGRAVAKQSATQSSRYVPLTG
jgi:hypothetical protein